MYKVPYDAQIIVKPQDKNSTLILIKPIKSVSIDIPADLPCEHKNKKEIQLFTSSVYQCLDCGKDLNKEEVNFR